MFEKISDQTIQQVKQYNGIVEFIGQYVTLKKRGQNYIGLCPFHGEKTPSFTVSPQKQIFHCFGCHESGDLIAFAQKIDNLTFHEAIEVIANFANISIQRDVVSKEMVRRNNQLERTLLCYKYATDVFNTMFKQSNAAQDYFLKRHVSEDSITKFQLGFCGSSKQLLDLLKSYDIPEGDYVSSGLFSKNQNGLYCRFQQRVMFPIVDYQARVVGFGARIMDADSTAAKYVNSEESNLFSKRKLLYGLAYAKQAIKKQKSVLLVEGYMDVIMCSQYGFNNVVACMGTSLTLDQIKLIKRLTDYVVIMFDNDKAGLLATQRSIELLLQENVRVDVVLMDNVDPADFLVQFGQDALKKKLNECISAFDFFYKFAKQDINITNINDVSKLISQVLPILKCITDDVVRSHYICQMSQDLKINEEVIVAKMDELLYNKNQDYSIKLDLNKVGKNKYQKAEETILAVICINLKLRNYLKGVELSIFITPLIKTMTDYVINSNDVDSVLLETVSDDLKSNFGSILMLATQYSTELIQENVFFDCLNVLTKQKFNQDILQLIEQIKVYEESGNETELEKVMAELDRKKKGGIYEHKY
tara:strand:- start:949 stop:2712 length:1764 start_codon:yes stop_codon:yes gene_type:complete